jgi:hypothetical protein
VEIVFDNSDMVSPKLSIILLDWSCRESFHVLDYLADQTIPREQYELIWIEYYDRRASDIDQKLKECALAAKPPPVDRWVMMRVPRDVYYHKHLMYNAGIVLSRGEIVAICDSDAIVKDTFAGTILPAFDQDRRIVLHLDQVRNNDKRFYPFNYPTIEEVIGDGSINWKDGKTTGLWDTADILHTRNYGACMAAVRKDLINVGGADEHIDYLGHICGPYDMTFRLVNGGKREFWHPEEFLYHVWHPGQAGEKNYIGPHDGRHMSSRALLSRLTGRILPFQENPAIQSLRLGKNSLVLEDSFAQITSQENLRSWSVKNIAKLEPRLWRALLPSRRPTIVLRLLKTFFRVAVRQVTAKAMQLHRRQTEISDDPMRTKLTTQSNSANEGRFSSIRVYRFMRRILESHLYVIQCSRQCLKSLVAEGEKEVSFYGIGDVAEILYDLSFDVPVKIKNVYDDLDGSDFHGFKILRIENCDSGGEKLIVTSLVGIEDRIKRLKALGVSPDRIIVLQ